MSYVVWFKDLRKDSIPIAGGKGANLGEMFNLGLPVPPGFAVTAQTYQQFIERTNLGPKIFQLLKNLDVEDTTTLQDVAQKIQDLIVGTKFPEDMAEEIMENYELLGADRRSANDLVQGRDVFVAVRSSATAEDLPEASFAGQQATFLNVKGKGNVIYAIRACWASLFTARAIYYRQKNNFDNSKVLICAVVQRMVNSDQSGIMFTINPATNNEQEIVIEAIHGLGEMIVGGEVTPNLYVVDKKTREIIQRDVRKQEVGLFRNEKGENEKRSIPSELWQRQVVPDSLVKELARLGFKLEQHYQKPQDIEWAIESGQVYIVQTRPVTTFKKNETSSKGTPTPSPVLGKVLLRGETAASGNYFGKVRIVKQASELSLVEQGDILVTTMTTPDMVPAMRRAGAIVTNEGGMTCHAAIVSREMGTPCVVGTEHATAVLSNGQEITVDATAGIVYEGHVQILTAQKANQDLSAKNLVTKTKVKVILDLSDMAEHAAASGADGIGLVRLEIIIAGGSIHPAEYVREKKVQDYITLLKDNLRPMGKAFAGKPVWVRCSDMRSDEYRNLEGGKNEPTESDPMIGWHGIRRLLDQPEILRAEFIALRELHKEGLTNLGIMLPFVIRVEEVKKAKEIMRSIGLEPCRDIAFGVMIETPASCWIIEDLCKEGLSFISFGTNDLTQLTLGIDRNNERLSKLFDEMHPAVLGEIAKVIRVCKKYSVETSICGQAGSRKEMAEFLVHQGVDSISSNVDAVDTIRQVVADAEKKFKN